MVYRTHSVMSEIQASASYSSRRRTRSSFEKQCRRQKISPTMPMSGVERSRRTGRARKRSRERTSATCIELPSERRQSRYRREVPVPGHQRKVELACHRGDPNVVVRDRLPDPSQFRFHLPVPFAGASVRQQEDGSLKKMADRSQLYLPPLSAKRSIVELAQDHPRQVNGRGGSQSRGEVRVVSEVRDDHVRVQQDTTSRVHRSFRSLPR